MTRDKIAEMIEKKKDALSKDFEYDYRYYICKSFCEEHPVINVCTFAELDIWYTIKCLISLYYDNLTEDECNYYSYLLKGIVGGNAPEDVREFLTSLYVLYDDGDIPTVQELIEEEDEEKRLEIAERLSGASDKKKFCDKMMKFKKQMDELDLDLYDFYTFVNFGCDKLVNLCIIYIVYYELIHDNDFVNKFVDELGFNPNNHVMKKVNKNYKNFLSDKYNGKKISSTINQISQYVTKTESDARKHDRVILKEISGLDAALSKLDKALLNEEITNVTDIVASIRDLSIKYAFLTLIDEHNTKYHNKIDAKLRKLSSSDRSSYKSLLVDYQIVLGNWNEINLFMHNDIEDFNKMLDILVKEYKFSTKSVISILKLSNLDRVLLITSYISKGYLSVSYLENNLEIFSSNSDSINIFSDNVKLLDEYSINPRLFSKSNSLLFDRSGLFEKNISILNDYDLLKYLKTTDNYSFLLCDNLYSTIDKFLELGYEEFLKQDLSLLNTSNIKRLELIKSSNNVVSDIDELHTILNSKKFYVNDDSIDDYIYNVIPYKKNENIDLSVKQDVLQEFIHTNRTYNFNGVIVSISKVNRLLNEGYSLFDSVISGLILNDDEYDNLLLSLKDYVYKK